MTDKINAFVNLFHKKLTDGDVAGARQMLLEAPMKDLQALRTNELHIKRAYVILNNPSIETPEKLTAETVGIAAFWGHDGDEKESHWQKLLDILEKEKGMVKRKETKEKKEKPKAEKPPETEKEPEKAAGGGKPFSANLLNDDEDIHSGDDGVFKDETDETPEKEPAKEAEPPAEEPPKQKPAPSQKPEKNHLLAGQKTIPESLQALSSRMENIETMMDKILEALQAPPQAPVQTAPDELTSDSGPLEALQSEVRDLKGLCVYMTSFFLGEKLSMEDLPALAEASAEDYEESKK